MTAARVARDEGRRASTALVIATAVTLAAAIPLGLVAWQARASAPVTADGLMVELTGGNGDPGGTSELSGSVLQPGADAVLRIDDPDIVAVSWSLYRGGTELVASDETVGPGPFVLGAGDRGVGALDPGTYELFVTATERDGDVVERAARFTIGDPE